MLLLPLLPVGPGLWGSCGVTAVLRAGAESTEVCCCKSSCSHVNSRFESDIFESWVFLFSFRMFRLTHAFRCILWQGSYFVLNRQPAEREESIVTAKSEATAVPKRILVKIWGFGYHNANSSPPPEGLCRMPELPHHDVGLGLLPDLGLPSACTRCTHGCLSSVTEKASQFCARKESLFVSCSQNDSTRSSFCALCLKCGVYANYQRC